MPSRADATQARLRDARRVLNIWERRQRSCLGSCLLASAHTCRDADWAPRHRERGNPVAL